MPKDNVCGLQKLFQNYLDDFSIEVDDKFENQNGMMANIVSVTLRDGGGGKLHTLIKEEKPGEGPKYVILSKMFNNELHFYKNIWKKLTEIYKEKTGKEMDIVPYCISALQYDGLMRIALKDITAESFINDDKSKHFDNEHISSIYKTYGKFHGLSMILKQINKKEYLSLVEPLYDAFKDSFEVSGYFRLLSRGTIPLIQRFFDPVTEAPLLEKIRLYVSQDYNIVYEVLCQNAEDGVVVHGDGWSNNYMFKYTENGDVEKVKLLDFQQVSSGSPVLDLSYCLYAGGCGDSFKKLDYYLKIYHDSLAETLKECDLEVEKIYPFKRLQEEWKKYCKFGFAMAVMLWRVKFIDKDVVLEVEPNYNNIEVLEPIKIRADKEDEYKQRIRELVYHMYDNDFF